jgi:hypothetical protein
MLISTRCDVDEVVVHAEFHQWPKTVKCVQYYARHGLYEYLQLVIIHVEDDI